MLDNYIAATQRLLQNPPAPTALYAATDLTAWINTARGQLAGESECVRLHGSLAVTAGIQEYNFSAINTGNVAVNGIQGVIHVSSIRFAVGAGTRWIPPRSWPWFSLYELNNPVPRQGPPEVWSQFAQGAAPGSTGSALGGSFSISPIPDIDYALTLDCVCYPVALTVDATPEAIPYLWTDAVPFFAAYYALLSAQNNARQADAERYYNMYDMFVKRAREASNPSVNRWLYRQAGDPIQAGKVPKAGSLMALFDYLKQSQRLLREQNQFLENVDDLTAYINIARREIALRTQCIRVLTSSAGAITGYSVMNPGTGYSVVVPPTVTVTAPDFPSGMPPNPNGLQATAGAIVASNGTIAVIDSVVGGEGYFQPVVTVAPPASGTTATAKAVVSGINLLNQGQEKYNFSDIDLSGNPGCGAVFAVRGISLIYSGYRYSLENMAWSKYQVYRAYPYQYQYTPAIYAQFGQGVAGNYFCYPLPSQPLQAEIDCQCLPADLIDDQSVEAIPAPWNDAVPYMTVHLALLEMQNYNASKFMLDLYEKRALSYSQFTRIGRSSNQYGRPLR